MNINWDSIVLESATKAVEERHWRDNELKRADIQLNKVQDGASVAGSVSDWRKYRQALRDYPQSKDFPSSARPVAPDNKG